MSHLLAALCLEAQALPGSAEAIPLADESVDAVLAAESCHWFDGELAFSEMARVMLLDKVGSLRTAAEYRRPWETYVYWTRLAG